MFDYLLIIGCILEFGRMFNRLDERFVRLYATYETSLDVSECELVRCVETSPDTRGQAFGDSN